ncbi:hypothetical protein KHP62_09965 [Rhodobacteraceae bacterium NNCM2]|nr:hypothetical protein [Coraliihabitans acroporae]
MLRRSRFIVGCLLCTASLWIGAAIGYTVDVSKRGAETAKVKTLSYRIGALERERDAILAELVARFDSHTDSLNISSGVSTLDALALVARASQRLHAQDKEIAALRQQIDYGLVRDRIVVINKVATAYTLAPPKLLMSVKSLSGGAITAYFGDKTRFFNVGQRVDLSVGTRNCFLILLDSVRGQATFRFGCDDAHSREILAEAERREFPVKRTSMRF